MADVSVPKIKICGVTSLDDAEAVARSGADALGLIYATSVRQVADDVAGDIVARCGSDLWVVGVFRHQPDREIIRIVERDGLHSVQLHDPASDELLETLATRDVRVIRALTLHAPALTARERDVVAAVIVDSAVPGSGVANDWPAVSAVAFGVPTLVAGGLTPDNVGEVIGLTNPWGVDVASGVEFAHGVKDREKVASFVTRAREALLLKGMS